MTDTVLSLRRQWSGLQAPTLAEVTGVLAASFVPPLAHVAPAAIWPVGLPRWYGKRFHRDGDLLAGVNLVRTSAGLAERLPMTARIEPSCVDARPVLAVTYAADAPFPWRWVRDEIRAASDGTFVGMTFATALGLHRLGGVPFLLRRV